MLDCSRAKTVLKAKQEECERVSCSKTLTVQMALASAVTKQNYT